MRCGASHDHRRALADGGMDYDTQQQAERIDKDMAFATGDLLAGIKALRVERRAPFRAALSLWLSMIAAGRS